MQKPTVGRIVHYESFGPSQDYKSGPRAAIITALHEPSLIGEEGTLSLAVLCPMGLFFTQKVPYSEQPKPGHWSWPPKV